METQRQLNILRSYMKKPILSLNIIDQNTIEVFYEIEFGELVEKMVQQLKF